MTTYQTKHRVRFSEVDVAGIVFFPNYLVWLNGLFEDWFMDAFGISQQALIFERRLVHPFVHIEIDFKQPSRLNEEVDLCLEVKKLGRTSMTVDFSVRQDDVVRVGATVVVVLTDADTLAPTPWPEDIRAKIGL